MMRNRLCLSGEPEVVRAWLPIFKDKFSCSYESQTMVTDGFSICLALQTSCAASVAKHINQIYEGELLATAYTSSFLKSSSINVNCIHMPNLEKAGVVNGVG